MKTAFINGYRLVNAIQRAEQNLTFNLPPMADRMAVDCGSVVKVILENDADGERFWVENFERLSNDRFRGRIVNQLLYDHGLDYSDEIEFGIQHICDIYDL